MENTLRTTILPNYNCSNCSYFISEKKEIFKSEKLGSYALECTNLVHPILDCILCGFNSHSEKYNKFKQSLNR